MTRLINRLTLDERTLRLRRWCDRKETKYLNSMKEEWVNKKKTFHRLRQWVKTISIDFFWKLVIVRKNTGTADLTLLAWKPVICKISWLHSINVTKMVLMSNACNTLHLHLWVTLYFDNYFQITAALPFTPINVAH